MTKYLHMQKFGVMTSFDRFSQYFIKKFLIVSIKTLKIRIRIKFATK